MGQRLRSLKPIGMLLGGTYQIERKLAEGGMGVVYEASHVRLPLRFAVKVLGRPVEDEASKVVAERFKREAQVTATLKSPHIVQIFDYQVAEGGFPFIVMELLDGEDLARRIQTLKKAFPPEIALDLLDQIAEGLDAAHAAGIVHRDLKPANVFLNRTPSPDFVKVLDFGISKVQGNPSLTGELSIVGTPRYMSPEQALSKPTITRAADIFSLGTIAYELLTGKRAFDATTLPSILYDVINSNPPEATRYLGMRVRGVDDVFARALAKDPEQRFGTAAELVGSLRSALRPLLPARRFTSDQLTVPLAEIGVKTPEDLEAEPQTTVKDPSAPVSAEPSVDGTGWQTNADEKTPPESSAATPPDAAPLPAGPTTLTPSYEALAVGASTPHSLVQPSRMMVAQIAFCALAVIFCATAVTIAIRRHRARAVPPAPSVSVPAQPAVRRVHLRIRTVPDDAVVELDGERLRSGQLDVPARASTRALHVSRVGYEPEDRVLPGDEDREVTVALLPIDVGPLEPPVPAASPSVDRTRRIRPKVVKPTAKPTDVVKSPVRPAPDKRPKEAPVQSL